MKKAATLTLTALYLFISSGMFICAVHCSAARVLDEAAKNKCGMRHTCKGMAKKNCCNSHANYLVKENLQTTAHFTFIAQTAITIKSCFFDLPMPVTTEKLENCAANLKGPPWKTGRAIVVSSHAFLI